MILVELHRFEQLGRIGLQHRVQRAVECLVCNGWKRLNSRVAVRAE